MSSNNSRPVFNISKSILDATYLALAQDWSLWENSLDIALQRITEALCSTLHVARTGIWILDQARESFLLLDLYDQRKQAHSHTGHLDVDKYPAYLEALNEHRVIDAVDAHTDYRTIELSASYLAKEGIGSLLDATLRKTGQLYGVLCIEHTGGQRIWNEHEKRFAISVADLLAQRLTYEDIRSNENYYRELSVLQQALHEEETRYRLLFESAGDSIFVMKGNTFVDCNPATLKMFGCGREQIVNETPYRFSPEYQPDGEKSMDKAIRKISAAFEGATQFFEWRHLKYDGTAFDAEVTLNAFEVHGEPHLLATVRNISERKNAERELENSRRQLMHRNENLALINELSNRLHGSLSVDNILDETLHALIGLSHTPHVAIYLADETKPELNMVSSHGFDPVSIRELNHLPLNDSLNGLALLGGQVLVSKDFKTDQRLHTRFRSTLLNNTMQSGVFIPLVYQEQTMGTINLMYRDKKKFSDTELETYAAIGKTVSLALVNSQHMRKLESLALHDSLTNLANRSLLHKHYYDHMHLQEDRPVALMLLDLDRFKEINDTLGHHIGDRLLQKVGPRLEPIMNQLNTLLCRLGGDEFTILIYDEKDEAALMDFGRQVLDELRKPFTIDSMILEIDVSIGIAVHPADGKDSHALLRSADVAMYEAKRRGGGVVRYDRAGDQHTPERLALIAELGTAIREGQLLLHYQPKLDLNSDQFTGFEALVRWQHPHMGLLFPDKFMHLAEVSDAIHYLSQEVLQQALQQQQQWLAQGYRFSVAVNLSARNLIDDRLIGFIEQQLKHYQTPRGMLELEITETALMQDPLGATDLLNRLSSLGIKVSIDDFGTGYSSLSYLRNLPIDALKIDREFVNDMRHNEADEIIVRSTIALAHNLGLKVIAEGVEDTDTIAALKKMGCDSIQGFALSKPRDWPTIEQWLQDQGQHRFVRDRD